MDYSVFFLSKARFYSWIFLPLILQLVITTGFTYYARPFYEELDETRAYISAVNALEKSYAKQEEAVTCFRSDRSVSYQEQFRTKISTVAREADVEVHASHSIPEAANSKIERVLFDVEGDAPSLHDLTQFLDQMMVDPNAVITDLSMDVDDEHKVSFEVQFDHAEFKRKG